MPKIARAPEMIPIELLRALMILRLGFGPTERRNSDRLDFKEVSVSGVRRVLNEAYEEGYMACAVERDERTTAKKKAKSRIRR